MREFILLVFLRRHWIRVRVRECFVFEGVRGRD